jgi:SAM-dependent methyltransferase
MEVARNFNPGLAHRFYFIRKGLYSAIKNHSASLKGKLLDFGCGAKPYLSLFAVDEYIGLDFDNPAHDHRNEQIDIIYDGKNIPFPDNHFDSILCSEVVEHLFDLPHTLNEMHRVLKKGGKMLVTCPFVWNEHELPYDYARYTQFALKDIFEKKGFSVLLAEKKGNFVETTTQLRVLYFIGYAERFFSRFSRIGYLFFNSLIFLKNGWGKLKSAVLPARYDLYLSNIFLVEKK